MCTYVKWPNYCTPVLIKGKKFNYPQKAFLFFKVKHRYETFESWLRSLQTIGNKKDLNKHHIAVLSYVLYLLVSVEDILLVPAEPLHLLPQSLRLLRCCGIPRHKLLFSPCTREQVRFLGITGVCWKALSFQDRSRSMCTGAGLGSSELGKQQFFSYATT